MSSSLSSHIFWRVPYSGSRINIIYQISVALDGKNTRSNWECTKCYMKDAPEKGDATQAGMGKGNQ